VVPGLKKLKTLGMKEISPLHCLDPVRNRIALSIGWAIEALQPEVKRPARASDYLSPPRDEVKTHWSFTSAPPYVFMVQCLSTNEKPGTNIATEYSALLLSIWEVPGSNLGPQTG
jgi:hypothetical protein